MKDVTHAYLAYQVHPDHAGLVAEVIDGYDGVAGASAYGAAERHRGVRPSAMAAHGYETDPASAGDAGSWTRLNERDLTDVEQPVLPYGFWFRSAEKAGPQAAVRAHVDAWAPSTYTAASYQGLQ